MNKKSIRFSAVAAVLLALCLVFMMPVGAENAITVSSDDAFKSAIEANEEHIVINLGKDITYDITRNDDVDEDDCQYITKTITINGNFHTLTFNKLDDYLNNIVTKNDAKLILKNINITNTGDDTGAWYNHDIYFCCDVELENVFSDKALAFGSGAKLTGVTIQDPSDSYAIWIQPKGQTIDINGLDIDSGRGIKIDKSELTYGDDNGANLIVKNAVFKTAKKSAILVRSADTVSITIENIDISNVAADKNFAVWVDDDSATNAGKVSVTGGSVKIENDVTRPESTTKHYTVSSKEDFETAVKANEDYIVIDLKEDITYGIKWGKNPLGGDTTKTITINGNSHTLTFNHLENSKNNYDTMHHVITKNDAKLILNNINITNSGDNTGAWYNHDIYFCCDVELEDVFSDKALAFESDAKLTDVTIQDTSGAYAIWIQSKGQTIEIDGLNIDSGRGIKIDNVKLTYGDDNGVNLVVKNAEFKTLEKSAIVVRSADTVSITLEDVDIYNVAADKFFAVWIDDESVTNADKTSVTGGSVKIEGRNGVIYDAGEGTGSLTVTALENGATDFTLPDCPFTAPAGKMFDAWQIDGKKYAPGESYSVTKDTTVTALWVTMTYDISATPTEVGFDSVKVGYTQPDAQPVIIKNAGNVPVTINKPTYENFDVLEFPTNAEIAAGGELTFKIQPKAGLAVGNYGTTLEVTNTDNGKATFEVSFLVYQPSSGGSSKPVEEPVEPEIPEEPEVPTEEPVAGEVTVETEVTDGGEVEFEAPVEEPEAGEGETPAAEDEAKITGVVLPTGTEGKVEFVPISEQAAPEGKETQTKKVFEINVPTYEKGKPATIKFTMTVAELAADGKEAADVALWHFDEETGEWTKLVTSYTIVDGVVYFEAITEDFSPFAIIYEDEPADEPVEEPETPASPAQVFAVLAALGAAVVLRRK